MSAFDKPVFCQEKCALFRIGKARGYECAFQEMQTISWNTRKQPPPQTPKY